MTSTEEASDPDGETDRPGQPGQPGPPEIPPPVLPRRRRLLFWSGVVLALAAVGGGAALAVTSYLEQTAPEQVVLDYLEAVAGGDAAAALAYGDVPDGERDLLTDEVLAAQLALAPMTDLAVDVDVSGDTAVASVSYSLGFADGPQPVEDTIDLELDGRTWRLDAVAVPVVVRVTNGASRATLAGAAIPDGPRLLLPGALPIAFDTENLGLEPEVRVVRFAQTGDLEESAELSEAGLAAVGEALDTALAACLDGTAPAPTLCPLPVEARSVPGSLRGTLATPASETVLIETAAGNDGLVRISGEVTVEGEYQQLDFANQRVTETGAIEVRVHAVCYATSPDQIIWRLA